MESTRASWLRTQFGKPTGLVGRIAGAIMAHRGSNRERARWTVGLLEIDDEDRVLEVGFGPGIAIELAHQAARGVFVAGLHHSELMLRQAVRRNAVAIEDGQVDLRLAPIERRLTDQITNAGFRQVRHERLSLRPVAAVSVLGIR
jgi:SAM-dependent methyltransferase